MKPMHSSKLHYLDRDRLYIKTEDFASVCAFSDAGMCLFNMVKTLVYKGLHQENNDDKWQLETGRNKDAKYIHI